MTTSEFAAKIRDRFPGAYDNLSDDDLTRRIVAKYPQYAPQVNFPKNPLSGAATAAVSAIHTQVAPSDRKILLRMIGREGLLQNIHNMPRKSIFPKIL